MTSESTRTKPGLALQVVLFASLIALFTLPGAFIVAGCSSSDGTGDLTAEQKEKVEALTVGKTEEEKKEMLKNLTEDQKKDLGLNQDQLNQLNQIQNGGVTASDPNTAVGGGVPPVVVPPDPGPIPPGGPGPLPPGGPGPLPGVP